MTLYCSPHNIRKIYMYIIYTSHWSSLSLTTLIFIALYSTLVPFMCTKYSKEYTVALCDCLFWRKAFVSVIVSFMVQFTQWMNSNWLGIVWEAPDPFSPLTLWATLPSPVPMASVTLTCSIHANHSHYFVQGFGGAPHLEVLRELFTQVFSTPYHHPKSKPFIDHIIHLGILDNRIWFRNYQVT